QINAVLAEKDAHRRRFAMFQTRPKQRPRLLKCHALWLRLCGIGRGGSLLVNGAQYRDPGFAKTRKQT
ncbi:hypothetical protein, partial [uncultured Phocaeicola sp.]|uniref:hypothetical protein n=1 Tax=uncultured Phocaeicola sp. TaxID=990718 RepID=UPI00262F4599